MTEPFDPNSTDEFQLDQVPENDSVEMPDVDLPSDVYDRIVKQVQEICDSVSAEREVAPAFADPQTPQSDDYAPAIPDSLAETEISKHVLSGLILKLMYLHGSLSGFEVARHLRLPFSIIDDILALLKSEHSLQVSSGDLAGRLTYQFQLTDQGRKRARDAFEACRYVGPSPVSLNDYFRQCVKQSTRSITLDPREIRSAFDHLVVEETLIAELGPAVLSGQSIFLHGLSGNGKTVIAKAIGKLLNECGRPIYVPYAVLIDGQIITVFDPSIHQTLTDQSTDQNQPRMDQQSSGSVAEFDQRWRQVRRPMVITGGELALEMLDLKYHTASGYYTAPLHVKANGGVLLLDDFGRQLVPPEQLLNRWILPLEEQVDFLTLATGKKFKVPFEQLILFSTNLSPDQLADAAFYRRIRHKIEISTPSEWQFREIFRRSCDEVGIHYDDWMVTQLLKTLYNPQRPPKSSDPRDLLDVIHSICRFKEENVHLSEDLLAQAWQTCLGGPGNIAAGAMD